MRNAWFVLVSLLVLSVSSQVAAQSVRDPKCLPPSIADPPPPPQSLTELWTTAAVVVHGVVDRSLPFEVERGGVTAVVLVRTLEVLKGEAVPSEIRLRQFGGSLMVAGCEVSSYYVFSPLQPDEEALLFLIRGRPSEFLVSYAHAGLFRLDRDDRVVLRRHPMEAIWQRDRFPLSKQELLEFLRSLRSRER